MTADVIVATSNKSNYSCLYDNDTFTAASLRKMAKDAKYKNIWHNDGDNIKVCGNILKAEIVNKCLQISISVDKGCKGAYITPSYIISKYNSKNGMRIIEDATLMGFGIIDKRLIVDEDSIFLTPIKKVQIKVIEKEIIETPNHYGNIKKYESGKVSMDITEKKAIELLKLNCKGSQ